MKKKKRFLLTVLTVLLLLGLLNFTVTPNSNTVTEVTNLVPIVKVTSATSDKARWKNKNFVTFGDSITWYDGKPYNSASKEEGVIAKGYQSYMIDKLNCVISNQGVNGADMTKIYLKIINYNYANVNAVTITSGANDHRIGVLPGEVLPIGSKFITTTFSGSLQASIEKIIKTDKKIKIYLITPIRGWYNENNTYDVPNAYKGKMALSEDYINVMKKVGKLYGIPVCDLFNSTWINALERPTLIADKETAPYYLHPSTKGYTRIADILIPFLIEN